MTYHTCPKCGYRRIRCNNQQETKSEQPKAVDFLAHSFPDSHIELSATSALPTIKYEVYWGIRQITDSFYKALAMWIPVNAIAYGVFKYLDAPVFIPIAFNVATIAACMTIFGQVPSWHNMIEQEPPAQSAEPPEPEDKREFVGWLTEEHTKTTQRITWYTPPCPISQAQSYALALVNSHFEWIDERDLKGKAKISGPNYRKLRLDWIDKGWCSVYGRKTIVTDRRMILKVAFDKPE